MKRSPFVRTRRLAAISLGLLVALPLAGCTGSADGAEDQTFVETPFKASNFPDPLAGSNKWLPLEVGTQWVREGTTLIGNRTVPASDVVTVTDVVREINGVKTVLVFDHSVAAGQVVQQSLDYMAQDSAGNVWYLGSATEQYEAGRYVAVDEAWLAGVEGAKAGILMPADLRMDTPAWSIAQPPESAGDGAEVVKVEKKCVPYGCFENVMVIREGKKTALDNEFKYYASGVGQILNEPRSAARHDDFDELINVTRLTAEGLEEASREALQIDSNAAREFPEVYGTVTASRVP